MNMLMVCGPAAHHDATAKTLPMKRGANHQDRRSAVMAPVRVVQVGSFYRLTLVNKSSIVSLKQSVRS
jgi:hypothetical protein